MLRLKATCIYSAAQRSAAQRSAAQRMCERTYMQMQRSAAQRSAAHHMLRLEATCIYSAAQRSAAYVWTHLYRQRLTSCQISRVMSLTLRHAMTPWRHSVMTENCRKCVSSSKKLKTTFFFGFSNRLGEQIHYHENFGGHVYRLPCWSRLLDHYTDHFYCSH